MIIHGESAAIYHAREAVSAGMIWTWISECGRQAWYESPYNPKRPPSKKLTEFDIGTATHLLVLEAEEFAKRTVLIGHRSYSSDIAKKLRDEAYEAGKTPLRPQDWELVMAMHKALCESEAAELLFGEGVNEVTYTWELGGPSAFEPTEKPIVGKARADRITTDSIIDLKTSTTASPAAFERAMHRDGHHVRAAWYTDGWSEQGNAVKLGVRDAADYLFVVVAKTPPHLVEVYSVEEESLAWGRTLIKKALHEFRRAWEADLWPGYSRQGSRITSVPLPAFAKNLLRLKESSGEFDDQDDVEIGY